MTHGSYRFYIKIPFVVIKIRINVIVRLEEPIFQQIKVGPSTSGNKSVKIFSLNKTDFKDLSSTKFMYRGFIFNLVLKKKLA